MQTIKQRIIELFTSGVDVKRIELEIPTNRRYINSILSEAGLKSNLQVQMEQRSEERNRIVREACSKGLTDVQIGELLGIGYRTAGYHRKKIGLPPSMPERVYTSNTQRIKGYIIRNTKFQAKRRNLDFDLELEDFDIPEHCPLLGIKLLYGKGFHGNNMNHASMDRIDNTKGYVKGNVMIISRLANQMKTCGTFEQIELFCNRMPKILQHMKTEGALVSITDIFLDVNLLT